MPHRTKRHVQAGTGLVEERFVRGNAAPCSCCGESFGVFDRASRLKEADGRPIKGYRRACCACAAAYRQARFLAWQETRHGDR